MLPLRIGGGAAAPPAGPAQADPPTWSATGAAIA